VLDELEGHLREEVQRLLQLGQPAEQAFTAALARLGSPEQLAAEFGKVPPSPVAWLPGRLALGILVALGLCMAWLLLSRLWQGQMEPLLAAHIFTVTLGYTASFAVGALAVWSILVRAARGWDVHRSEALRAVVWKLTGVGLGLTIVGVLLGAWWAGEHLGRSWAWDPKEIGGSCVLVWYGVMLLCLLRGAGGARTGMLLGIAGNVVVSLSWFGPALVAPRQGHSYGFPTTFALCLLGFVVVQLLLLALAFVPAGRLTRLRA
jgi:hypothetical protein